MKMHGMYAAIAAAVLTLGSSGLAHAQAPYVDSVCGAWNGDTWVPNASCQPDLHRHERIEGTITIVKGHLVTVAQSNKSIVIDDTPALANKLTGEVAVGRQIVAHGYWDAGTFYATIILTRDAART
jgi:hypothetical protein